MWVALVCPGHPVDSICRNLSRANVGKMAAVVVQARCPGPRWHQVAAGGMLSQVMESVRRVRECPHVVCLVGDRSHWSL